MVALMLSTTISITRPLDENSDDAGFYLRSARLTSNGAPLLSHYNIYTHQYIYNTSVGPLYPAFLAVIMSALRDGAIIPGLRAAQVLLNVLSVWLVYQIGKTLFGRRAGLVAMAAMALDIRFALQAPDPTTETLYTALELAGLALYLKAAGSGRLRGFFASGAIFGLATLTRPVPILLPFALVWHALLGGEERKFLLKGVGVLAMALWAVIIPWTIRNAIVTGGELIPVSNTAASNFWMGSTNDGRYHGHEPFYDERAEEVNIPVQPTPMP
jgi:4-amino-4-deoxy-L-arabinose transferase-like glycosyltransferase